MNNLKKDILSYVSVLFVLILLLCGGCDRSYGPEYPDPIITVKGLFSYTYKEKELIFNVKNDSRRTCELAEGGTYWYGMDKTESYHYAGNEVEGNLEIPSIAYAKTTHTISSNEIVDLEFTVIGIGYRSFYNNKITSVTIPETVESIGVCAFEKCGSLRSISIPESVTKIGNAAFEDCSSLTSITLPSRLEMIAAETFNKCSRLRSIKIPDNVNLIGARAFAGCSSLREIKLPRNLNSLYKNIVEDCSSLISIYCPLEKPLDISNDVFGSEEGGSDVYDTATLYVPEQSVEAYQTTEPWCNFKTIRGYNP